MSIEKTYLSRKGRELLQNRRIVAGQRIWSGDTIDGFLVVFCDQVDDGFYATLFASRENGRIVARSLGGTWLGATYDLEPSLIAVWLDAIANTALGQVRA